MSILEEEKREGAESLFKEIKARTSQTWESNWILKFMKLKELLIISKQKTFSKKHYIKAVKKSMI